jgi:hypothetical protein
MASADRDVDCSGYPVVVPVGLHLLVPGKRMLIDSEILTPSAGILFHRDRLTRDVGRYRTYFPPVEFLGPT